MNGFVFEIVSNRKIKIAFTLGFPPLLLFRFDSRHSHSKKEH